MSSLDEEEVLARNIASMGQELGTLFTVLSSELIWQYWRWSQFEKLFGDKPTRVELLNSSAPVFFSIVQSALWHDAVLGISRLAGPDVTKSKGETKQNLSVRQLPALLEDQVLRSEVVRLIGQLKLEAAFAMDWRNRHIAHRDLGLALGQQVAPLAHASRLQIRAALTGLAEVLNCVALHFLGGTQQYDSSPHHSDAEDLLYVLRDGLRRRELRLRKLQDSGGFDVDDWDIGAPAI